MLEGLRTTLGRLLQDAEAGERARRAARAPRTRARSSLIGGALLLAALAIGQRDDAYLLDTKLWMTLLVIQSVPYVAAVTLSLIGAAKDPARRAARRRRAGTAVTEPARSPARGARAQPRAGERAPRSGLLAPRRAPASERRGTGSRALRSARSRPSRSATLALTWALRLGIEHGMDVALEHRFWLRDYLGNLAVALRPRWRSIRRTGTDARLRGPDDRRAST